MEETFTLTIIGHDHGEWQGILQGTDGSSAEFQSILELLRLIKNQSDEEI